MAKIKVLLGHDAFYAFWMALIYYSVLCAKGYTWVFRGEDAGDWLAASNWWMVPQPYGSPLYILLGHFLNLFPGDLVIKMTVFLSVLPSAITVTLVYLIVRKLTSKRSVAAVASLVLASSAVFLTQSTILEEYAITTMLVTLGFWFYINDRRYVTAICWGLAVSVHVFVIGAIFFWLIVEWRRYLKPAVLVTTPIVTIFYGFILLLMHLDTPRLLAGGLNIYSLNQYLTVTSGAILGQLSIFETPKRLLLTSQLILMSFGLALIPLTKAFSKPISKHIAVMLGIIFWTFWYQITNLDPAAWTFITYASPSIAILVGIGLSKMGSFHLKMVCSGAMIFFVMNGCALNANHETNLQPLATDYYESLWEVPDGSIVLANTGSHSLGLFYVISEGKDLVPLIYPYMDDWNFFDYGLWLNRTYGIETYVVTEPGFHRWKGTLEVIKDNLKIRNVYYADTPWRISDIRRCLKLEATEWMQIKRVTGLTGLEPKPFIK